MVSRSGRMITQMTAEEQRLISTVSNERKEEIKKEVENSENNSNNTRNSQENFVSLSEIPGTPQNTEVKETQKEVFETVKVVNPATEQRLINSLIKKYQEDKLVSERDIAKFEAWKQNNPEQWKKICK
jgi:hypothetical protein